MTDFDAPGTGEAAAESERKAFWNALAIVGLGGALAGGFLGFYFAVSRQRPASAGLIDAIPPGLLVCILAISAAAFAYGCWRFYRAIDEVELNDNLWGSTAAYYLYATLFPLWWILAEKGLVPPVSDWALYFTALLAGCLGYGWRKWRAR